FAAPLPSHLLAASFQEDPVAFLNNRYWSTDYVGNGPFIVRDFQPGTSIRLEAFDGYVVGRPRLDEVNIRFILDANALAANILAGDVDLTLGPTLSIEQSQKLV